MGLTGTLTDINLKTGTIQGASCGFLQVRQRGRTSLKKWWLGRGGPLIAAYLYLKKTIEEHRLFSEVPKDKRQQAPAATWETLIRIQKSIVPRKRTGAISISRDSNKQWTTSSLSEVTLLLAEDWTRWPPGIPSKPNYFVLLQLLIIYYHSTHNTPLAIHSLNFYESILHFKLLSTGKHLMIQNTHLEDDIYLKKHVTCIKKCSSIWNKEPMSLSLSPISCKGDIWTKMSEKTAALQSSDFW